MDPVSRSSQPLMSFEENLGVSDNGFPSREYAQGIFIFQFRGGSGARCIWLIPSQLFHLHGSWLSTR